MSRPLKILDMASLFAALADGTRLRLLNLMGGREICVCHFVEILGQSQPKISRHLAYLRRLGVVAARRQGKWMHYRIVVPENTATARILNETLSALKEDPVAQADLARLNTVCCDAGELVAINRVPPPRPLAAN